MVELKPQERRHAQTRRDIIETAHQIIVEQGLGNLSIRALADSIDYTPGALYKYFASKDELIDAVRGHCFAKLNAFIADRIQGIDSAAEMLLAGGMAYIEYAARHPQDYHLMFHLPPSAATSGDQREQAMAALLHIVQFGLARGEIVSTGGYDEATIVYHCWAMVHGMAMLQTAVLRDEQPEFLPMSRIILQQVIAGFTTQNYSSEEQFA